MCWDFMKSYNKWNIFEKKFFWLNNLVITVLMVGSVVISALYFLSDAYKFGVITGLIICYAVYRCLLWNNLERLETEYLN